MAKVEIALVAEVLSDSHIDPAIVDRVVRQITRAAEKAADEAATEREPAEKKQWVIILADPHGELPALDLVGWVVQVPEQVSPATALERITRAAHHYHTTRRGRKQPVRSFAEACEVVGAKYLKEEHVAIKTKLPVTAIVSDNTLPADEGRAVTLDELRRR
ncbi:MAG: hypothetical protein ACREIA_01815 [Opitutaceae bacterium]